MKCQFFVGVLKVAVFSNIYQAFRVSLLAHAGLWLPWKLQKTRTWIPEWKRQHFFPLKSSNIQKRNIKDLLSSQCLFGDLCIIFVCYFTRCSVTKCIPSIPPKASLLSPILKQSSNTFNFATKIPETTNRIGLTIGSSENETHRFETAAHSQYSRSSLRFSEGAS